MIGISSIKDPRPYSNIDIKKTLFASVIGLPLCGLDIAVAKTALNIKGEEIMNLFRTRPYGGMPLAGMYLIKYGATSLAAQVAGASPKGSDSNKAPGFIPQLKEGGAMLVVNNIASQIVDRAVVKSLQLSSNNIKFGASPPLWSLATLLYASRDMSIFFGTAISKHKEGMDYWLCQSAILVSSTKFYLAGNFSAANKGIMEGIVEMARKGDIPKVILMRVFRLQCISAISLGPEGVLKKVGLLD